MCAVIQNVRAQSQICPRQEDVRREQTGEAVNSLAMNARENDRERPPKAYERLVRWCACSVEVIRVSVEW